MSTEFQVAEASLVGEQSPLVKFSRIQWKPMQLKYIKTALCRNNALCSAVPIANLCDLKNFRVCSYSDLQILQV